MENRATATTPVREREVCMQVFLKEFLEWNLLMDGIIAKRDGKVNELHRTIVLYCFLIPCTS
jgi:hypothetical protein